MGVEVDERGGVETWGGGCWREGDAVGVGDVVGWGFDEGGEEECWMRGRRGGSSLGIVMTMEIAGDCVMLDGECWIRERRGFGR